MALSKLNLTHLPILILVVALSSCGVSTSMVSNINQNQTKVSLNKANFVVVGKVSGESSATYIFGIGGLENRALLQNAHSDMLKNADLVGKSRAIINVTYESHVTSILYPIFGKKTIFVHGLVVEFFDGQMPLNMELIETSEKQEDDNNSNQDIMPQSNENSSPSGSDKDDKVSVKAHNLSDFKVGDRVEFIYRDNTYDGEIIDLREKTERGVIVSYKDNNKTRKAYITPGDVLLIK